MSIMHRSVCPMQYYDDSFPTLKDQTKFEESLFNKTRRSNGTCVCVALWLKTF